MIDIRILQQQDNDVFLESHRHPSMMQNRKIGMASTLSVAKFIQLAVIQPGAPASLVVSKFVQYQVIEVPPPLPAKSPQGKFSQFFQQRAAQRRKSITGAPLGRRIYVFTIT